MKHILKTTLTTVLLLFGISAFSQIAKEFKGNDILTGQSLSLSDFKGKYVYLDFWGNMV